MLWNGNEHLLNMVKTWKHHHLFQWKEDLYFCYCTCMYILTCCSMWYLVACCWNWLKICHELEMVESKPIRKNIWTWHNFYDALFFNCSKFLCYSCCNYRFFLQFYVKSLVLYCQPHRGRTTKYFWVLKQKFKNWISQLWKIDSQ